MTGTRTDGPAVETRLRGQGALLAALVVDGAGTGRFLPFAVLYFVHTTTIPLATIGFSMTAAGLLALPTPLVIGPLIDRYGPRRLAVLGNLLSAAGFVGYLFVGSPWALIVMALLAGVGKATGSVALVA